MAKRPVDEVVTTLVEVNNPSLEIVHFKTQSTDGDYYDCKKLATIKGTFATNLTSADKNIQVSSAVQGNGVMRITLVPEEASTEGYLVIEGSK